MTETSDNTLLKPLNMIIGWIILIFLYLVSPIYQGYDMFVDNYFQVNWAGKISGKGISVLYDGNNNGIVEKWPIGLFAIILTIFFICSFLAGLYWNEFSKGQVTLWQLEFSFYLQIISLFLIAISSVYVASYDADYKPTLLGTVIWLICLMELYVIYSVRKYWNERKSQKEELEELEKKEEIKEEENEKEKIN
ncbi:MAG: hypothetical protein KAR35_02740 [Candidatus Heimdallarchaeota archaeon]|nr:hypothetical protein [Candidatus Heimdallarchaeota archaeon]MCK5048272.1 hypothetical protein [Candidatus Heimdallarchaeota archaeon]